MLIDIINENLVIPELTSANKEAIIGEMASRFQEVGLVEDVEGLITALKEREKIESTAIGSNIAIPHARSNIIEKLVVAFARSSKGVDFESLDGKPVHLIFMIIAPPSVKKEYLQTLARIARLCKNEQMRAGLMKAKDTKEIMGFIKGFDLGAGMPEEVKLKEGRTVYPNSTY